MFGKKGYLLFGALFLAVVLLTGRARLTLDELTASFRDDFQEMLYLPRGGALKIIACGFDAPLADMLFIKGIIYTAESFQTQSNVNSQRKYTYALFDVITDLAPRFSRAYQLGALLLSASASLQSNQDSCVLLDKGVAVSDKEEKAGQPINPDPRWLFHVIAAQTYESSIQTRLRRAGDIAGASEARRSAGREFQLAAASPGAPGYIREAAIGYASVFEGGVGIENARMAMLVVLRELYSQAQSRGDKDVQKDLEDKIDKEEKYLFNLRLTRRIEDDLSLNGKKYLETRGKPPESAEDLVRAGLIPGLPKTPLDNDEGSDAWLALPDGAFKSRKLASLETENHLDVLLSACIDYRRDTGGPLLDLNLLVQKKYIAAIPEPPLKLLGQRYELEGQSGVVVSRMPEGPEPPPAARENS